MMPFAVTLAHQMPLRTAARRRQAPRRIRASVTAAIPAFLTLWLGAFRDLRAAVTLARLTAALETPQLLEARTVLETAWHAAVDVPIRALLPVLATAVVDDAARATLPALGMLAGQSVTWTAGLPETQQGIATYTGTQVELIRGTTLETVQTVLRDGWLAERLPRQVAREVRTVLGLTPRQQRTIATVRARLEAQGTAATAIQRLVDQMARVAVQYRGRVIAETEVHTFAQMGTLWALQQAIRSGKVGGDTVRRYWHVAGDERQCAICAGIPGLNPNGVGADVPFQTSIGPIMTPSVHPSCRCEVNTERNA